MKIFVDIDGVLADFDAAVKQQFGIDVSGADVGLKKQATLPWDELDYKFYSTLPVIDGAYDALRTLELYGEVYFLSGTIIDDGCYSGKFRWLCEFLENKFVAQKKLILCNSKKKHLLAAPGRILIDDRVLNIHDWEEAGGQGILFKNWTQALEEVGC